jgi:hypothetical protein
MPRDHGLVLLKETDLTSDKMRRSVREGDFRLH